MKRDLNLMRNLLLDIEAFPTPDEGEWRENSTLDIPDRICEESIISTMYSTGKSIRSYQDCKFRIEECFMALHLMMEMGWIRAIGVLNNDGSYHKIRISGLTTKGFNFLNLARCESRWGRVEPMLENASIELIEDKLREIAWHEAKHL